MPSVKNPREWTHGILEIVNKEKDKNLHSVVFPIFEDQKGAVEGGFVQWVLEFIFRERGSGFSPGFRPIRPSVFNGARRKVALRDEDYAWAPIWWSSDNSKR